MTQLKPPAAVAFRTAELPMDAGVHHPPVDDQAALRAEDLRAGRIIGIMMNAIFLAALVLYGSIALAVALGGHP